MISHNVIQGSPEWHALRAEHFNASEAPAMMGESKYMSRAQLIRQKATGVVPEVDAATQRRFDAGHDTEAKARAILEQRIGEELYPVVGTRDKLLASVDGIDMLDSTLFEHKLLNQDVVAMIEAGELTGQYYWQLEQQLYVTGAERVLFVCSDGTEGNFHMMEYRAVPGRIEQLIAGWEQFAQDVAAYQPEESVPEAVGKAPESLPALRIELTGMVTASNLDEFKSTALTVIGNVNDQLETDQDFADAEQAVKWCSDVEGRLKAAKDHALSQTSTIDELFRALDEISETARQKRLALDKLVKARKTQIREDIVMTAAKALTDHIAALNEGLGPRIRLPDYRADFNGAIKGKKTIASLRDAADTELARAKIEVSQIAEQYRGNLELLRTKAEGFERLFPDAQQLVAKAKEDLEAVITARIAEHRQAEQAKLDAERERIEREAKAAADAAEAAKTAELAAEAQRQQETQVSGQVAGLGQDAERDSGPIPRNLEELGATIKLGDINARLGPLSISADGLAQLGIQSVGKERSAVLYAESDWPRICAVLIEHLQRCHGSAKAA
ncbi:MAG TPA: Heme peroxidase [Pseudomonas sp.]|nr:Heme peroxidase [Pseudomonas sp.]MBB50204.1 Heme peroxidase [Pseudomonadales bacterium]MBB50548.1 Heme peroxidase [Pseudomonadales bacterium]MBO08852.1 Heme peroxidase [Acidobacteriota bacterium]HCA25307.1 Heme peroxidase [Pseudomonas sp.]|tara:strand:+ start:41768 stop:43444 length:1677 start_codon:yes stop_codon:yes gene_type:complete